MYLGIILISFLFLSVVQAAPAKHATTSGSKPHLKPLLPKPNHLVEKLVVFDPSCTADQTKRIEVEQALSDFYDVAEVAQHITEKDPAFNNYFITKHLAKPPTIHSKVYPPGVPHRNEIKVVPNMAKSILTGGGNYQKFTVKCLESTEPECEDALAFVRPGYPTMNLCPAFFSDHGVLSLSSKTFTPDGWCTPPKHLLSHFITKVVTIIHESTHFMFIATHALELSITAGYPHPYQWWPLDIMNTPDENNPVNLATYGGSPSSAARVLKQHWDAYIDQPKNVPDSQKKREPPLETSDNAESYALAFTEYYFFKKCERFGFNPREVVLDF